MSDLVQPVCAEPGMGSPERPRTQAHGTVPCCPREGWQGHSMWAQHGDQGPSSVTRQRTCPEGSGGTPRSVPMLRRSRYDPG